MPHRLEHPYENLTGGRWLRGNLHAHTTASDGRRPLQEVLDDYAAHGYGFLMISDHDIFSSMETYETHDAKGMIMIPGNEITTGGVHMLHVNGDRRIDPHPQRQRVINHVNDTKGFVIVNHPNWRKEFNHCPIEKLREWIGYAGIEIYNGIISMLDGSPYATNKWDMLLTEGRRIWGFANDDSHYAEGNVGLGWNVAYVDGDSPDRVSETLHAGRFYASTGVVINQIEVDGLTIRIETENADRIVALRDSGTRIQSVDSNMIEVEVPDTAPYARFECWGRGESFAWTQPFFVVEQ